LAGQRRTRRRAHFAVRRLPGFARIVSGVALALVLAVTPCMAGAARPGADPAAVVVVVVVEVGGGATTMYSKRSAIVGLLAPRGALRMTSTVPEPGGAVASISIAETTVNLAGALPKRTSVTPSRASPMIGTSVPAPPERVARYVMPGGTGPTITRSAVVAAGADR
jgi:hypothetical protein